ncbi:hypothetical protein ACWD5Q_35090, partial [Streptomyces sp. NPDC002513]
MQKWTAVYVRSWGTHCEAKIVDSPGATVARERPENVMRRTGGRWTRPARTQRRFLSGLLQLGVDLLLGVEAVDVDVVCDAA